MNEEPVRVFIHPLLLEELKIRKEAIEVKEGYAIRGGIPIVSKIVALELKMLRTKQKGTIKIDIEKVKGEKKVNLLF